jgi:hypothetical protein
MPTFSRRCALGLCPSRNKLYDLPSEEWSLKLKSPKLALLALTLVLAACEPQDRRPGTWLSGEVVHEAVTDWSFANDQIEVHIQTHPWYGIPHSVTTVLATANGQLFVPSIYMQEPKSFPEGKYWNRIVSKDPNIEVKIGGKLYPRTVRLITDEEEFALGLSALAAKYPYWQNNKENPAAAPTFVIMSLDPRSK